MSRARGTASALVFPRAEVKDRGIAPADPLEADRTRLAYAIHDGLTQVVTASVLELEWLSLQAETGPVEAVDALRTAAARLRESLEEIRGILAILTPGQYASAPSIEELVHEVTERWHLPATWSVDGDVRALPVPIMEAASSVIREGFANAAKHADPCEVEVRVQASRGTVEVSVQDDGKGFRPEGADQRVGHLGLEMMRHRVAQAHGTLDVQSAPGSGTRLVARFPAIEGARR